MDRCNRVALDMDTVTLATGGGFYWTFYRLTVDGDSVTVAEAELSRLDDGWVSIRHGPAWIAVHGGKYPPFVNVSAETLLRRKSAFVGDTVEVSDVLLRNGFSRTEGGKWIKI